MNKHCNHQVSTTSFLLLLLVYEVESQVGQKCFLTSRKLNIKKYFFFQNSNKFGELLLFLWWKMASFSLSDEAKTFTRRKEEERRGHLDEESREKLSMVYSWLSSVYGNRQPPEWEMNPYTISFVGIKKERGKRRRGGKREKENRKERKGGCL